MQSKCSVLPGKTANTPDGSNAPEPIPILMRIDGGLSSIHIHMYFAYFIHGAIFIIVYEMIFNYVVIKMTNYKFKCDGSVRPIILQIDFSALIYPRCESFKFIANDDILRPKETKELRMKFKLPEKFVNSVVGTHDGIRGAHNPLEHRTRVSPSNLYNPKSLQRACNDCPCGTSQLLVCKLNEKKK